ncbi:hypothetical protein [Chondromyces crocatus]|nr:hypothetical protein [Chondromyces crocatus]
MSSRDASRSVKPTSAVAMMATTPKAMSKRAARVMAVESGGEVAP